MRLPDDLSPGSGCSAASRLSLAALAWPAFAVTVLLGVLCCGVYPLGIWAISQTVFSGRANGSFVQRDGTPASTPAEAVGSTLLAQGFAAPHYFHPRPSSAGAGYDAANSGGSNLGPLSDKLLNGLTQKDDAGVEKLAFDGIRLRVLHYALENDIQFSTSIPLDVFKDSAGNLDDVKLVKAFPHVGDPPEKKPLLVSNFSTPIPGDAVTASGSGLDPHIRPANAAIQKKRVAAARGVRPEAIQQLIDQHTQGPDFGVLGDPRVNVLTLNLALDAAFPITGRK
jgi:K+-transporting ATPase ATPase C chain